MTDDGDMTDTTRPRTTRPNQRLERSREDRVLAGVAGGLGTHLGISAWWFRFAFIILAFFGGFGVLLYVAAWLVIPDTGERDPIVSRWLKNIDLSDGGTIFGVVLVGAAAVILLTQFADFSGTLVVALVLFVIGLLLYRGDLTTNRRPDGEAPPEPPTDDIDPESPEEPMEFDAPAASAALVAQSPPEPPGADAEIAPPPPPEPPKPRERSVLGRLTVAVGLIVVAAMALLDLAFDSIAIEPVHYFAAAVGTIGIGLLVGAFLGKARWLIIIGVLLLPALWISSIFPSSWDFSAGQLTYRPATVQEVDTSIDHGVGQIILDLTLLSPAELAEVGAINVELGAGELIVRLPDEVGTQLTAEVGFGEISGPFRTVNGVGLDIQRQFGPPPTVLDLNLEVGAGVINITGPSVSEFGDAEGTVVIIEGSSL